MAGRGPAPLSKATLQARGSWRAKQRPDVTAGFQQGRPRRPAGLRAEVRRCWDRVIGELLAAGVVSKVDRALLLAYCELEGDIQELRGVLRKDGLVIKAGSGAPRAHPAVKLLREAEAAQRLTGAELGLSPAARSKLSVHTAPAPTRDDLDKAKFFDGGALG